MKNIGQLLFGFIFSVQVFTSSAQVFSSDGTGYVNITLVPGFNLVANPLNAADNSIGALFKNMQGGVPDGTTVYKFVNGNFVTASYFEILDSFEPADAAAETTGPGEGVLVFLAGNSNKVLTFVGQVLQGQVCTPLPQGFSIKSNVIPRSESLDQMQIPTHDGDVVFRFDPVARNYAASSYVSLLGGWDTTPGPFVRVGEAFFFYRTAPSTTWCRTFVIPPP
jgi:hypothetical protein